MAEEAQIIIDVEKAKRDLAELTKRIKELNAAGDANEEEVKALEKEWDKLDNNIKKFEQNTKPLARELKEITVQLQNMKLRGQEGTTEYAALIKRAGQLRDAMADTSQAINKTASDTANLDAVMSAASAVSGGFGLVTATMSIFGKESEDVAKAQKRLQQAIALVNSVQLISKALNKDSALMVRLHAISQKLLGEQMKATAVSTTAASGAMKTFRAALISTGIGALVVALGFAVSKLVDFVEKTNEAKSKTEEFNKRLIDASHTASSAFESSAVAMKNNEQKIKDATEAVRDFGKTNEEMLGVNTQKMQENTRSIAELESQAERAKNTAETLTGQLNALYDSYYDETDIKKRENILRKIEQKAELVAGATKESTDWQNKLTDAQVKQQNLLLEEKRLTKAIRDEQIKKAQEYLEIVKNINKAYQDNNKTLRDMEAEFLKDDPVAYYEKATENLEKDRTEAIKAENERYAAQIKKVKENSKEREKVDDIHRQNLTKITYEWMQNQQQLDDDYNKYLDGETAKLKDLQDERLEMYKENLKEARLLNASSRIDTRRDMDLAYLDEKYRAEIDNAQKIGKDTAEIEKAWANERKRIEMEAANSKLEVFQSVVGNISDALATSFEDNKGVQIATTVANTAANAAQTFGSVFASAPGGPAAKAAQAAAASAAVVASGVNAIANIKKTTTSSDSIGNVSTGVSTSTGTVRNTSVRDVLVSRNAAIDTQYTRRETVVVLSDIEYKQRQAETTNRVRVV